MVGLAQMKQEVRTLVCFELIDMVWVTCVPEYQHTGD